MIPLHEPNFIGNELKYVKNCIVSSWVSSSGKYLINFSNKIKKFTGAKFAIPVINGTSALQISLKLAGTKFGNEVIVPTITYIATVNSIIYNNANPVFMDVDEDLNIDVKKTIEFILKETKMKNGNSYNKSTGKKISAIIIVHVLGNAVDIANLKKLCKSKNIFLIEDATESLGTKYCFGVLKGKHTGTVGDIGCLSFNGNKIITSGGGGMILTNNKKIAKMSQYLTTQAKDNPKYYIHNEVGYNFRLSNIQAAIGLAQIENLKKFLIKKRKIYIIYKNSLNRIKGLKLLSPKNYSISNHWLNVIKIEKIYKKKRDKLISIFEKKNINVRPIWFPNHLQKPFLKFQRYKITKAVNLVKNCLCLPSGSQLKEHEIKKIVNILNG